MSTPAPVKPAPARPAHPRRISRREAQEAAARLKTDANGRRIVLRFTLSQRLEHQLLIVSFTMLAVTGLPQRFANTDIGAFAIQLLGGIETARQIHHMFATLFLLETVYHVGVFLYGLVMHGGWGSIWPSLEDVKQLIQMLALNLGLSPEHPRFGRYTFEEKAEYWAMVWGSAVMILTGLMQWFPALVTRWLPGSAIPLARAFHGWEALLAALALLTWHTYHVVLKHFNKSIFTGYLTEEEMREEHPAELAYLERAAARFHRLAGPRPGPSPQPAPTSPDQSAAPPALEVRLPAAADQAATGAEPRMPSRQAARALFTGGPLSETQIAAEVASESD